MTGKIAAVEVVTLFLHLEGLVRQNEVIAKVKELSQEVTMAVMVNHVASTVRCHGSFHSLSLVPNIIEALTYFDRLLYD